jgi:peptidoglycan hydrolase CwlO-like protein
MNYKTQIDKQIKDMEAVKRDLEINISTLNAKIKTLKEKITMTNGGITALKELRKKL